MGPDAFWMLWIVVVALWGLSIAVLALNGITEVTTGRAGFLQIDRWLRKRSPASRDDFVLRGATGILQAFGFSLFAAPTSFMMLLSTTTLATGLHPPSPPTVPIFVGLAVFGAYLGSIFFGMVCLVWAYIISLKVRYVSTEREAATTN